METPKTVDDSRTSSIHNINRILLPKKWFPSRDAHLFRENFNYALSGDLIYEGMRNAKGYRIFKDTESGWMWIEIPWYLNIFHCPHKFRKFIHYDSDHVKNATSSCEIFVNKKKIIKKVNGSFTINRSDVNRNLGSFNYRDFTLTNYFKHFFADILPVVIYGITGCCYSN